MGILFALYCIAVGTTACTMVLALVSKSCDSSLHMEATARYLQQLAEFIQGVELASMGRMGKQQKEKLFPSWLHYLQPKHTPHEVDNPASIRAFECSRANSNSNSNSLSPSNAYAFRTSATATTTTAVERLSSSSSSSSSSSEDDTLHQKLDGIVQALALMELGNKQNKHNYAQNKKTE